MKIRCEWAGNNPLYIQYHDEEWGIPIHDDRKWFEKILLDSAQAGLSWITILRKRENYRKAYDGFDFKRVAEYDELKGNLDFLSEPGIRTLTRAVDEDNNLQLSKTDE